MSGQVAEQPSSGTGRSLVVRAAPASTTSGDERPRAEFLTQLIACRSRLPAYRASRRAAPDDAATCYDRDRGTAGSAASLDLVV